MWQIVIGKYRILSPPKVLDHKNGKPISESLRIVMYMLTVSEIFSQELNSRAQGEVSIREALRELELWGAGAVFSLTSYVDSHSKELSIIKDWKDLVNQVQKNKPTYFALSLCIVLL